MKNYNILTFQCKNQTQIDIISQVGVCPVNLLACGIGIDVKEG